MSVQSDSILELFDRLCILHLGETKRCHLVQPKTERDKHLQHLRRTAFDSLFSFLKSKKSSLSGVGVRVEVNGILKSIYQLRLQRQFDDANQLERLLEQLLENSTEEDLQVLRILVQLAGTCRPESYLPLGYNLYKRPIISADKNKQTILPIGPLYYGDSWHTLASCEMSLSQYMHYPPELFKATVCQIETDVLSNASHLNIFASEPGTGITSSAFFSVQGTQLPLGKKEHQDKPEYFKQQSLFQTPDTSLAVKLELPDLSDDPQASPPYISVPKTFSISELSEEEGYVTTETSSVSSPAESFVEEDIWELALTVTPSQYYVWERIGCEPVATERPYLTEAGFKALDKLCHVRRHHEYLLDPSTYFVPVKYVPPAQLVKDIIYLLVGIPSQTFPFSETQDSFGMDPQVSTSGLCPESLQNLVSGFIQCGTHYHHLAQFSAPQELDSFYTGGLVLQAFTRALRSVLQYYRAAVLSLPKDLSLLALKIHCYKVLRQMRFLAELCMCENKPSRRTPDAAFPKGVPLISYLYHETLESVNTENYLLMLSLLRTTCQPFILFIKDWVFYGTFRDVYGEFMIQVNHEFLEARDELYWEKGYTLTTEDETSSVPTFLAELAPAIFRCGKALNLLRMCNSEHFLCCVNDSEIPWVSLSFLRSDLQDIRRQCEMYVSRMRQIARQLTMSRAEQQRQAEEAQKELLETAQSVAAMEIARLQGILDKWKQKENVKKRQEFKRLEDQMTTDLQRRAAEKAEAKEQDKQFMALVTRQEAALTQQEIDLEKQARDELIAYYAELGEEAAKREQRALWRIRRARLETARLHMLSADAQRWQSELEEHKHAQDFLKRDDAISPPAWVQRQELEGRSESLQVKEDDTKVEIKDGFIPKNVHHSLPTQDLDAPFNDMDELKTCEGDQSDNAGGNLETDKLDSDVISADQKNSVSKSEPKRQTERVIFASEILVPVWSNKAVNNESGVVTIEDNGEDENASDFPLETGLILDTKLDRKHSVLAPDHRPVHAKDTASALELGAENSGSDPQSSGTGESSSSSGLKAASSVSSSTRNPTVKTSIQMVDGMSTSQETEEKLPCSHIQFSDKFYATTESTAAMEYRSQVKQVAGMSSTKETQSESEERLCIRLSESAHATKQTQETAQKPHLRMVADHGASIQSQKEVKAIPKLTGSLQYNIATETTSEEWKIKKPSLFGHVSQLSRQDSAFQAPRLKRQHHVYANLESDFRDFTVRSNIRLHQTRSSTAESEEQVNKPMIRSFSDRYANKESEFVDLANIHRKRFLERNIFGHSSDSTVQRLLYGDKFGTKSGNESDVAEPVELFPRFEIGALDMMPDDLEKFDDNFKHLNDQPMVDLMASMPGVRGRIGEEELSEDNVDDITFTPLSVLLQEALLIPLSAQISLVNETVVNYFLADLKIDQHLEALRRYLFMAEGDFAQNLTNILMEKLSSCQLPVEMLSPMFLNSALNRALQLSAGTNQQHAENLSFALKYMPDFFRHNAHDTLDCLELRYKVEWPVNVVLTESSQACYGLVFSFMLQLKRVAWTLTDCWYKLKRDALVKKAKDSCQFRCLQLHRQEMLHFVHVMQGYMAHQIIQVTWKELQESLDHDIHSLDDFRQIHADYLEKALFRCLLNKKAARIMKIIQDIFCLILKFCSQLASASWEQDPRTGKVTHPNFAAMVASFNAFKEYFLFLFKVVNKLAVRGYQPHLQELVLRLNFNNYYATE